MSKFDNLICALDIKDDKRKKALLLHYCGEETYDIYDSFSDAEKGIGATREVTNDSGDTVNVPDEYNKLCNSFKTYFMPKQNLSFEVYKFRQARQEPGEGIDSFYTRLRTLASTCEFHDKDSEIVAQVIQGCTSSRIRRRALRDNYTLDKLIEETRALELSEKRATEMEASISSASANTVVKSTNAVRDEGTHNRGRSSRRRQSRGDGRARGRGAGRGRSEHRTHDSNNNRCGNCGGNKRHQRCPAVGKECRNCKKLNHFEKVCRSKAHSVNFAETLEQTGQSRNSSSDEYVFNLHQNSSNKTIPSVHAQVFDSSVEFLVDTGSSVNVVSRNVYNGLKPKPSLKQPVPLIYAYNSSTPLDVAGYFTADIKYKGKSVKTELYVVESPNSWCASLLGSQTAQSLNIIHFAFTASVQDSISEQYPSLFDGKMGKINGAKVKLHIDKEVPPVTQRHRRIPFHTRKDVETEIKRLEDLDVIEPVSGPTPWISPIVIVPKKSNNVRICIDMREANKAITREKHPMPTVEDLMADLNSSVVFSKLDLSNAYHQLELEEDSRYITTFSTHMGLWRYKRLLFGVNAASEIFQKRIADLLSDIPGAKNISDDIIVHGKSQADHDHALKLTLDRLSSSGAKLNKDKCIFSVNKITFFGHVFSNAGVSADPEKVKSIVGQSPPQNSAEIRSFLGMTQYVARYIPHYATLTEPLRRLTRQDVPWRWSRDEQNSFDNLKSALSSSHVMVYFDPHKHTEVLVDASPVGVSAILTQEGKVVCYASRALTDVEQRYSQTDREMLAVVYGVEHYHLYLFASEFRVITDHKPLLGIVNSQKPASARMERWRLRLMPYQFTLEYRPGKSNPADYMSRHPCTKPSRDNAAEAYIAYISQHAVPKAMSINEVKCATQTCPILQQVMIAIQSGRWWGSPDLSPYVRFRDEFSIIDGVILRDHRLVIPSSLQHRVVDIAHQSHQGIVKTKQLIREKVWFPGIDKLVEQVVKSCIPCQVSLPGPNKREPVSTTTLPSEPWSEIAVDFAGPFPSGHYMLVVVDEHSRFPEVEIIHSTSAKAVIPRLNAIFSRQGYPKIVKSDNGPPFQGQEFAEFATVCGFRHRRITPLWPEANGTAERFMSTLNKFVHAAVADKQDWKNELSNFLMHYRATPHSATQISPFEALTGRKMNIGFPEVPKPKSIPLATRITHNDAVSKSKMKEYADKKRHTTPSSLSQGDHVLVKQRKLDKLTPPYNPDPYTVIEKRGSMVIADRDGHTVTRNSSQFRPVKISGPIEDEESSPIVSHDTPGADDPQRETSDQSHSSPAKPKSVPLSSVPISPVPTRRNPRRTAGMPKKYADFELG